VRRCVWSRNIKNWCSIYIYIYIYDIILCYCVLFTTERWGAL